jgi:hypothetical protein
MINKKRLYPRIKDIQPSMLYLDESLVKENLEKLYLGVLFKESKIRIAHWNCTPFKYYSFEDNEKLFVLYKSGIETIQFDIKYGSFEPFITEAYRAFENKIRSFKDLETRIFPEKEWFVKSFHIS